MNALWRRERFSRTGTGTVVCSGWFAVFRGGELFLPRRIGQCLERALYTAAINVEGVSMGFVTRLRSSQRHLKNLVPIGTRFFAA